MVPRGHCTHILNASLESLAGLIEVVPSNHRSVNYHQAVKFGAHHAPKEHLTAEAVPDIERSYA